MKASLILLLLLLQPAYYQGKYIDCRVHMEVAESLEVYVTLTYEAHGIVSYELDKLLPDLHEDAEEVARELFGRELEVEVEAIGGSTVKFRGAVSSVVEEREQGLMVLRTGSLTVTKGIGGERIPRYIVELEVVARGFYLLSASPRPEEKTATRAVWRPAAPSCMVEFCRPSVSVAWKILDQAGREVGYPYRLNLSSEYNLTIACESMTCIPLRFSASLIGYNVTLPQDKVSFRLRPAESKSFTMPFNVSAGSWMILLEVKDLEGLGVYKRILIAGIAGEQVQAEAEVIEEAEKEEAERAELQLDAIYPAEVYIGDSFLIVVTVTNKMSRRVAIELHVRGIGVEPAEAYASKVVDAGASSMLEFKLTAVEQIAKIRILASTYGLNYTVARDIMVRAKPKPTHAYTPEASPYASPTMAGMPATTLAPQLTAQSWKLKLLAALVAIAVAAIALYVKLRPRERAVSIQRGGLSHDEARELEEEKRRILSRIRELKEAYDASLISDRVYEELRELYDSELKEVERKLSRLHSAAS